MSKISIDYIGKTVSLFLLALFLFVLYFRSSSSNVLFLISGAISVGMMILYNIIYFTKRKDANAKFHINGKFKPHSTEVLSQSLKPVQVSQEDQEKITIGKNYYNGKSLPKDFEKAFSYLFDGALAGNAEAQMLVGKMFLFGQGVSQNTANACTWLEASSFQGNTEAQYLLGRVYSNNEEDKVSMVKAFYFLEKAASQGNNEAKIRLKEISKNQHLTSSLKKVPDEVFFDIEHNPFIKVFCSEQNFKSSSPKYTSADVKKSFELLGIAPTMDLEQIHKKYLGLMLKLHPDRNFNKTSAKNILSVRKAYDILEHFVNNQH